MNQLRILQSNFPTALPKSQTKTRVSNYGETANKNLYTDLVLGAAGLVGFGLYYKHAFIDKTKPSAERAPLHRRGYEHE